LRKAFSDAGAAICNCVFIPVLITACAVRIKIICQILCGNWISGCWMKESEAQLPVMEFD
jgi:hypothetical protein